MTKTQRIKSILGALYHIIIALILMLFPIKGFFLVAGAVATSLILYGIGLLVYYRKMARYMVGGKAILYQGVLLLDAGLFAGTLFRAAPIFILIYVVGVNAFTAAINIMRAMEAREVGGSWKLKFSHGVVNAITVILCVVFIKYIGVVSFIYAIGSLYSSCISLATVFRRTAIVYVQQD